MAVRKSVRALSAAEKADFTAAVLALKTEASASMPGLSTYDTFPVLHQRAMEHTTPWSDDDPTDPTPTRRNAAHRGPAFLPWHREFLRRFEAELQRASGNPQLGLPYWDWEIDPAFPDFIGGDGTLTQLNPTEPILYGKVVDDGPFAAGAGWEVVDATGNSVQRLGIQRAFALAQVPVRDPATGLPVVDPATGELQFTVATLPAAQDVQDALAIAAYDAAPWDESGDLRTFRNVLEGWWRGPRLHNLVHVWVGGSMGPGTSPNDPVFFLHHCNVDRIWFDWQTAHPNAAYAPQAGGPDGHNLNDPMFPWDGNATSDVVTPRDMLVLQGASYEAPPPAPAS